MRWVHPHTIRCAFICTASSQCRLDMSCHSHGNKVMFRHFCLFFFFIPFVHQFGSSLWLAWHSFHWRHTTHLWRGVCIMYICDAVESTPEVEKRASFVYKCTMANAVTPFRITKVSMKLISMAMHWEVFANRCTIAQNLPRMNHIAILNCIQFVGFCNLKRETTNILIYGYRLYILWVYKRCLSHMPGQRDTINCVSWCRIICMPVSVSGGSR